MAKEKHYIVLLEYFTESGNWYLELRNINKGNNISVDIWRVLRVLDRGAGPKEERKEYSR